MGDTYRQYCSFDVLYKLTFLLREKKMDLNACISHSKSLFSGVREFSKSRKRLQLYQRVTYFFAGRGSSVNDASFVEEEEFLESHSDQENLSQVVGLPRRKTF